MKRIVAFNTTEIKYSLLENGEELFSIDRNSLQFDVKAFYQAFFADDSDYSEIEIISEEPLDKSATHVFNTIKQLTSEICKRLEEDTSILQDA